MSLARLSRRAAIFVTCAGLAACGGEPMDEAQPQQVPITQLVVLGDSLASGFLVDEGGRYYDLLLKNDALRYPSFNGQDLTSLAPEVQLVNLAGPGDSGEDTVRQAFTVPPNRTGRTLVIFSIGLNDLVHEPERLLTPEGIASAVEQLAQQARAIVERFSDKSRFPHGATVISLEPVDATDRTNNLPEKLADDVMCRMYVAFIATGVFDRFNVQARESLKVQGVETLALEEHFIGHGWHYDNPAGPAYDPADPSSWLADCWHPNARGQHEIRRLIWDEILTSELPQ